MVRLKENKKYKEIEEKKKFQFLMVRLKVENNSVLKLVDNKFQFLMVRLKEKIILSMALL